MTAAVARAATLAVLGAATLGTGAAWGHGVAAPAGGSAPPENDLTPLPAIDFGQQVKPAPVQINREPPLEPTPRARCRGSSRPLAGMQGRVPASAIDSPEAERGWTCNLGVISHHPTPGGFRVWRYADDSGHTCAFYDTSIASPLNVVGLAAGRLSSVAVLDMSDPAHPVPTDTLTSPPMLAPHESLNLNRRRGLLAAELGNGLTLPGLMSVYDVSQDCRHPVHRSTFQATRFGHESGFSRDGKTYWIGGGIGISAVDVTNPSRPRTIWSGGNLYAHGLSVSRNGNRLYDADPINGHLAILDVGEVQARKPAPKVREISRLTWGTVTVPQNALPIRIDGRPYLLEFDEFGFRFTLNAPTHQVGAARIIDISNKERPRIVSNIRLKVNQRAEHEAVSGDPGPMPGPQFNYSAHYCAVPREVNPEIVACSFINSGLRIFNIENPRRPHEVAYFIAPPEARSNEGGEAANFAMSQPAFDRKHRQVWYTDATSGFYALKLSNRAWPR